MPDSDAEEGEVRGVVNSLDVNRLGLLDEHLLVFHVAVADPEVFPALLVDVLDVADLGPAAN